MAAAATVLVTAPDGTNGSSAYRRHLARVLVERALASAWGRVRARGT